MFFGLAVGCPARMTHAYGCQLNTGLAHLLQFEGHIIELALGAQAIQTRLVHQGNTRRIITPIFEAA